MAIMQTEQRKFYNNLKKLIKESYSTENDKYRQKEQGVFSVTNLKNYNVSGNQINLYDLKESGIDSDTTIPLNVIGVSFKKNVQYYDVINGKDAYVEAEGVFYSVFFQIDYQYNGETFYDLLEGVTDENFKLLPDKKFKTMRIQDPIGESVVKYVRSHLMNGVHNNMIYNDTFL